MGLSYLNNLVPVCSSRGITEKGSKGESRQCDESVHFIVELEGVGGNHQKAVESREEVLCEVLLFTLLGGGYHPAPK